MGENTARKSESTKNFTSLLIVDQSIEHHRVVADAAFVLGLSAGREIGSETFGRNVLDGEGKVHRSLTQIGHNVRKAAQSKLRTLRDTLVSAPDTVVIDYTDDAEPADYEEYARSLASRSWREIRYRAVYVYGPEEVVTPLTEDLSHL